MSATIHGIHAGRVVIEDDHGQGAIPVHHLGYLIGRANAQDRDWCWWNGRRYQLADLIKADDDRAAGELLDLPDCWVCFDGPAITTDLHDRPVCLPHAPDDNPED